MLAKTRLLGGFLLIEIKKLSTFYLALRKKNDDTINLSLKGRNKNPTGQLNYYLAVL
jgi:hypothetical protein